MAFVATHIRIAAAVKEKYNISDIDKYISGTVYPDSRYITGIDRVLTHDEKNLPASSGQGDFVGGWAVHIICDKALDVILEEQFPEILAGKVGREQYLAITPLKIILDMFDVRSYDIGPYLPRLKYILSPNNEPAEVLKKYYKDLRDFYERTEISRPKDYMPINKIFNFSEELVGEFVTRAEAHYLDKAVMAKMKKIYDLLLARIQ